MNFPARFRRFPLCLALAAWLLPHCGINTDDPVFPIFADSTYNVVGAPAIESLTAVESFTPSDDPDFIPQDATDYRIQFDITYFITNQSEGFLGYNLYITSSSTAAEASVSGLGTQAYLPDGVEPSFPHPGETADAHTDSRITKRVTNFQEAPGGETAFDICNLYFFRITALTRSGVESNPSPELSSCAAVDTTQCPEETICNP